MTWAVSSVELFDPESEHWSLINPMPTQWALHTATLLPNGRVLITAGWNSGNTSHTAELFDPSTRRFVSAENI
jgi:hypothetical protein